jgi:hypothetical protein
MNIRISCTLLLLVYTSRTLEQQNIFNCSAYLKVKINAIQDKNSNKIIYRMYVLMNVTSRI